MKTGMKVVALGTAFMFAGCASIVSKSNWPVTLQSNPTGASCVIATKDGAHIHKGETPLTVTLSAKRGFFSSENYTVTCEKEGYELTKADMPSSLNGWYWGNIVFGGLIGILIVDPATGAMWKLEEAKIVNLTKTEQNQSASMTDSIAPTAALTPEVTSATIENKVTTNNAPN